MSKENRTLSSHQNSPSSSVPNSSYTMQRPRKNQTHKHKTLCVCTAITISQNSKYLTIYRRSPTTRGVQAPPHKHNTQAARTLAMDKAWMLLTESSGLWTVVTEIRRGRKVRVGKLKATHSRSTQVKVFCVWLPRWSSNNSSQNYNFAPWIGIYL